MKHLRWHQGSGKEKNIKNNYFLDKNIILTILNAPLIVPCEAERREI